jgi:hypothetical protein
MAAILLPGPLLGADTAEDAGTTEDGAKPRVPRQIRFETRIVDRLPPWEDQEKTWPHPRQRWLPHLPPLSCPVATGDFDADGHTDIVAAQARTRGPWSLLLGQGTGEFSAEPTAFEDLDESLDLDHAVEDPLLAIVPVDADADGDLDLHLVRWGANALLVNDGRGRFVRRSPFADAHDGLHDAGFGATASFFDADGDGDLDLYVGNVLDPGGEFRGAPNRFYRNRGGRFEDETTRSGLGDDGMTVAVRITDEDRDGDPDVLVVNFLGPASLYRNEGDGRFARQFADTTALLHLGCDAADVDGDSRPDLLVTAVGHPGGILEPTVLRLSGENGRDAHRRFGLAGNLLAAEPRFLDFDSDGRSDLILGRCVETARLPPADRFPAWISWEPGSEPNPRFRSAAGSSRAAGHDGWTLFRNRGAGWMERVRLGLLDRRRRPARRILDLDADEDGRVDLLIAEAEGDLRLLLNRTPPPRRGTADSSATSSEEEGHPPDDREVFRLERALRADPVNLDLGDRYRDHCSARGLPHRSIAFFHESADPGAPFAWSLQRFFAYIAGLGGPQVLLDDVMQWAGHSVYELDQLAAEHPKTWVLHFMSGVNRLYWPPLFGQTPSAIAAFVTCLDLQKSRRAEYFAETYVGLGDAHGILNHPEEAMATWRQGAREFPAVPALEERLRLSPGEVEDFCRRERDLQRVSTLRLPWLEEELEHTPWVAERADVAARVGRLADRRTPSSSTDLPVPTPATHLHAAQRRLDRALEDDAGSRDLDACREELGRQSLSDTWPALSRGLAYADHGFLPSHLEQAERDLDSFCEALLESASSEDSGAPQPPSDEEDGFGRGDSSLRALLTIGLVAWGDALVKLGRPGEGEERYRLAEEVHPGNIGVRLRSSLPLSTDPSAIWSGALSEFARCPAD